MIQIDYIKYTVEKLECPIMLREYLIQKRLSKTIIKKAKFDGLFVNGEKVTVRRMVNDGDVVELMLPQAVSTGIPEIDIPLTVLYEDEHVLAIDKPKNMPTHPSKGNNLPTLANAVMARFGGNFVFRAVNRLDRDTSGIVLIAKNAVSASRLSDAMKRGEFVKKYTCITEGVPSPSHGIIDAPIRRESENSIKRIVASDGKDAKTEYTVIKEVSNGALCEVRLYTGRTHQIRVHMAHIGTPLYDDFLYGKRNGDEYFLRCTELSFPHPESGDTIVLKAPTELTKR